MTVKLKICGIRTEEEIDMVNEALPDYIGFVFAESRRKVDLHKALLLRRKLDERIKSVGVFVDEKVDYVIEAVKSKAIDIVQLHGTEDDTYIRKLKASVPVQVIKAVRMGENKNVLLDSPLSDFLLADSFAGSGRTFDWSIALQSEKPLFIAGGIGEENIERAFEIFQPYAFDLSSSVETNGYKDREKIRKITMILRSLNGVKDE
ncbi:MAG: phosphoribosylanthranilate isomerase [Sphaerochaetaceae bacterium]